MAFSELGAKAKLLIPGADVAPAEEVPIALDGSYSWSVRPRGQGHHSGKIILDRRTDARHDVVLLIDRPDDLGVSFDVEAPSGLPPFKLASILLMIGGIILVGSTRSSKR
jgi:hypothetical protein